jgi:formylglycine-generating enzyme required for sulfatase activity
VAVIARLKSVLLLALAASLPFASPVSFASERGASAVVADTAPVERNLQEDLFALVIGVSHYTGGWNQLDGVPKDVEAVSARLELSNFKTEVVRDPTRAMIEQAFAAMRERLKDRPAARLLVYYAGHGVKLGDVGYLVPADAPPAEDEKAFKARAVRFDWVREQLVRMPARHAILLLDNCFSGAVFTVSRGTPLRSAEIEHMVSFKSREIVSAGSDKQTVPDVSIFRKYFVAALAGAADRDGDGYITGSELAGFLKKNVANESKGRQTPLSGKIEEFIEGEFVILSPLGGRRTSDRVLENLTPTSQPATALIERAAGDRFRDCDGFCPWMVALPSGKFVSGAPLAEAGRSALDELSGKDSRNREVKGFAISQHEVTFDLWDACFQDGGCTRWPDDLGWGRGGRPVINVSWTDAIELTAWLSLKTGQKYRLPSEVEWEYAARGGMTTARHWGDELGNGNANCRECGGAWSGRSTATVGSYPPNGFKLHDMLGNVWEWTRDCWRGNMDSSAMAVAADPEKNCAERAIRGGSFSTGAKGVRSAARSAYPAGTPAKNIGIRVVRETGR